MGHFYETDANDAATRHARGYDALDAETFLTLTKLRPETDAKERRSALRAALAEHVASMRTRGLVVEASFAAEGLGFSVALARYGDLGRTFVVVEATERACERFDDVYPGDELVEVNGAMIVDPKEETVAELIAVIANAPRPLVATFVRGENREEAFARQEGGRGPAGAPKKRTVKLAAKNIYKPPGDASLVIVDRDGLYRGCVCADGSTVKDAKGALLGAVDDALGVATDARGVLIGKVDPKSTDGGLVALLDAKGATVGYADLGRAAVLAPDKTTVLEVDGAGEARGHDGLFVGAFLDFTYHQTKLVAFIYLIVAPKLLQEKRKSVFRAIRKSASKASGAHGFFAKAA